MCRQRVAMDFIESQPDCCGMSKEALLLHKKQCEDFEAMQKEINSIKNDMSAMKKTQEEQTKKIDELIVLMQKKSSFWGNIKDVFNNKVFLYLLISIIAVSFGVSVAEVGLPLLK